MKRRQEKLLIPGPLWIKWNQYELHNPATLNDTIHELARALVTTWVNMLSCFPGMRHWAYYGIFGPEMDHAQNGQWARLLEPIMSNHGDWSNMMFYKSLATRYEYNILQQQNLVSPGSCQLLCSDLQCQFWDQVVSSHTPKNSAPGSFLWPFEHHNSVNKSCGHGTRWPMLRLLHGLPMRYVKLHWDRWRSCSLPPAFEESDHWYPAMSSGTSKFEGNAGGQKHLKAVNRIQIERLWHIHTKF